MSNELSGDAVFGDLDVRVLDHDQHLDWVNDLIRRTLRGKESAQADRRKALRRLALIDASGRRHPRQTL